MARPSRTLTRFLAPPRLTQQILLLPSRRDRFVRPPTPEGFDPSRAASGAPIRNGGARTTLGSKPSTAVGGLELAALAGAVLAARSLRLPVVLDSYPVAAAAPAATQQHPTAAERLIARRRSAEPGHDLLLNELGLEPLLDLRLRLGKASGALPALPVIGAAGALHRRMGTFAGTGVARAR